MLNTKYLNDTQEERVTKLVSEIALLQKEGAVQDSIVDVNYNTARKIQKEIENFYYEMITRRMSAEAAKEQAAAMIDKIAKDYELGNQMKHIKAAGLSPGLIYGDRKSTRLNSSHSAKSRMPSSA